MVTKISVPLLFLALIALTNCKSSQLKNSAARQAGLFKVTILYPAGDGKTFDMDYYEKKHMPMLAGFLGQNLEFYEIDKGISGRTAADKAPFVTIGYFYVQDIAEYNKAIVQNREAVINDLKNYTNIQPVIQVSEVAQVVYPGAK